VPFHLRPSAPTAADALICGDPARALTIAQHVMVQPRMSNHNRGLWGYYGETPSGRALTVQATGIGGPSAVVVLGEAVELGGRRFIRIGTCAAVGPGPHELGSTVVVGSATAGDGASAALNDTDTEAIPDRELTSALVASTGAREAAVASADLLPGAAANPGLHDLQTAAVLTLARRLGTPAAAALVVRSRDGRRLEDEPLEAALLRLADAAVAALELTGSGRNADHAEIG
jgi:uridine phosphorylase